MSKSARAGDVGAAGGRASDIELAKLVRSSQSRVAKMETGDAAVSIDLLVRSLLAIGASPKDIARAIGRDAA